MHGNLWALISARQHWLGARFAILSQNVANADTPNYRPRDLTAASFAELLDRLRMPEPEVQLLRTHPRHFEPGPAPRPGPRARLRPPLEIAPAGNAVLLAEELRKLGETQRNHLLNVNLVAKYKRFFRSALGAAN